MPPAAPSGQHSRDGAVVPAGTKRKAKKQSPAKKLVGRLSVRERVMIMLLVILVVTGSVTFLVILPAVNTMQAIQAEVADLEVQKSEIREEPDVRPQYQEQLDNATRDYENYQHFYYPFMDPETIDRTVTGMLLDNDLTPLRLSMTAITPVDLPPYATRTLVPKPVPSVEGSQEGEKGAEGQSGTGTDAGAEGGADGSGAGDGAGTGDGSGTAEGGPGEGPAGRSSQLAADAEAAGGITIGGEALDSGADADADAGAGGLVAGSSIYCYTVDVEAKGWMTNLFSFFEATKSVTAMEVVAYSYASPSSSTGSNSPQNTTSGEPEGGTISLQIRLYVFVAGGVTSSEGE
jgi:cell division protein FtsL